MRPMPDFTAMQKLSVAGIPAYYPGDDVTAHAVESQGWKVGVHVMPARPDVIPLPAGNASREDWAAYAIGQGVDVTEVEEMTATQLKDRFRDDKLPNGAMRLSERPKAEEPKVERKTRARKADEPDDESASDG